MSAQALKRKVVQLTSYVLLDFVALVPLNFSPGTHRVNSPFSNRPTVPDMYSHFCSAVKRSNKISQSYRLWQSDHFANLSLPCC
jgi:hypothetical protein